jgi:hypothetical protein
VLLPGRAPEPKAAGAPTGIAAVRSCLLHAASFPRDRIRITGHGPRSLERAESALAMLTRSRDRWAAAAARDADERDTRSILAHLAELFGWDCDPAVVGDLDEALLRFEKRYNQGHIPRLAQRPAADQATFGALFDLYWEAIAPPVHRPDETTPAGRPLGPAYLVIQRTDSIWPVKVAEIARRDANRYVDLNPLNPHLQQGGNWHDLWAGDEINVPADWVGPLRDAGYVVLDGDPPPEPAEDHPDPLAEPGPEAIGCGDHHPVHPHKC